MHHGPAPTRWIPAPRYLMGSARRKPRQLLKASPRARPKQLAAPQPTARQLAAAVVPGATGWVREHPAFEEPNDARLVSMTHSHTAALLSRGLSLTMGPHPTWQVKQIAWAKDIADFADLAGVLTAPSLYQGGAWCDEDDDDADPEYLPCHRVAQVSLHLLGDKRNPTLPLPWDLA